MIVQACINGARAADYHPRLPLTVDCMAADAKACIAAGAAELHIHPRADGRESLAAIDQTIPAIRAACPGTFIGVSTGAWIEKDVMRTRDRIRQWTALPDYASVNLSEKDAPAVISLLGEIGVGVEAGFATVADAERFVTLPHAKRVLRILIEIDEQDWVKGQQMTRDIEAVLLRADISRPILLHGFDATVWRFVDLAAARHLSTRVGLEDGKHLPDGTEACDNAELVSAAVGKFRQAQNIMAQS